MDIEDFGGRASSAKSLLTTMLGEFVVPGGGSVWTATVIDGLAVLGITERNARQAVARLADHGVVTSERVGRRARWRVTERGVKYLTEGAVRIAQFGELDADWDGTWVMAVCSVSESQRSTRNQLRSMLAFEGFAFIAPQIAVCPHVGRIRAAKRILDELGLSDAAITMTGTLAPHRAVVEAFDLDTLEADYRRFVATHGGRQPRHDDEAFAATLQLVDDWRRFPFRDPELPAALLPKPWSGATARDVFIDRRAAWAAQAQACYSASERRHAS